jgi:hypothetical protein
MYKQIINVLVMNQSMLDVVGLLNQKHKVAVFSDQ